MDHLKRLGAQRGQAIAEFALILPVFLLLVIGMLDLGGAYDDHNDMTQLAGEAARFAAVDSCGSGSNCTGGTNAIVNQVLSDANNNCFKSGSCGATGPDQQLTICFDYLGNTNPGVGDEVRATVESGYRWLPYLGLLTSKLKAQATVRIEQYPSGGPTSYSGTTSLSGGDCPTYPGP